ncbi:Neoverrucotoxin subunit beta [Merluccius polli]|uniref:Neoverrucotoxin subunit beta n=1 Tax=Merluccius polli TaxID=89951 RepID=A0AA47MW62_MERPO|nr:Neoverrucotoxin subunit beta [Merluccius polli]
MSVDSHWTQTQHRRLSLSEDQTERISRILITQRDLSPRSREGLTARCYWEVEWRGDVEIGVTYRGITRRGGGDDSALGRNKSWSLYCRDGGYSACYNGVHLDRPAGSLSFYRVSPGVGGSSDTLTHIHTFHTTFTQEDLLPGFRFYSGPGSSVFLYGL